MHIYIYIYRERERHVYIALPLSLSLLLSVLFYYMCVYIYIYIHIYIYIYIYICPRPRLCPGRRAKGCIYFASRRARRGTRGGCADVYIRTHPSRRTMKPLTVAWVRPPQGALILKGTKGGSKGGRLNIGQQEGLNM